MQIALQNFGGVLDLLVWQLESQTIKNGAGKTTLVNAYLFALTGKALNGFTPRNVNADPSALTQVTLYDFMGLPPIRRVLKQEGGTTLYVGADVATQEDFNSVLAANKIDLSFVVVCANANALTSDSLDVETLRKLLSTTDILDGDEYAELKKEQTAIRRQLKVAENNALTNVVMPSPITEVNSEAENIFFANVAKLQKTANLDIKEACQFCGRPYDEDTLSKLTNSVTEAKTEIEKALPEFTRIADKRARIQYAEQEHADAKRLLDIAARARKDVVKLDAELTKITEDLNALNAAKVELELPEKVELITELPQKNGKMKPTLTLTYEGIPLKSINRAKLIELLVSMLDTARNKKGMQATPIIIDNAEAVGHDFVNYQNVVLLSPKRN